MMGSDEKNPVKRLRSTRAMRGNHGSHHEDDGHHFHESRFHMNSDSKNISSNSR